jgi:hypothetical protein
MALVSEDTQQKLVALGFIEAEFGMQLTIGSVQISAAEGLFRIAMIFTQITRRSATQYETNLPYACGSEQIARLIYANVRHNFRESLAAFAAHFDQLAIVGCCRTHFTIKRHPSQNGSKTVLATARSFPSRFCDCQFFEAGLRI